MTTILEELAVLTGEQVLEREATGGFTPEQLLRLDRNARTLLSRSWRKIRGDLDQYSRLIEDQGYTFNALRNPVDPVAHAKSPLLPLLIQIIPPEFYPTGQTRTIEIPSPQTSETQLTGFVERVRERTFSTDPRNPGVAGTARRVNRIVDASPGTTITVEVPELTEAGQESQVRRTRAFLQDTQRRYFEFQRQAKSSRRDVTERSERIRLDQNEVEDVPGRDANVKRARSEQIAPDLDALRRQAQQLLDLPPLLMYVNPTTFGVSHEFIVSDGNKTRNGHTIEFWGEQQPKLTMSGEVGAFWTDTNNAQGQPTGGLSLRYRKGSYAYQNFLQLFQTYRNNGYLYTRRNAEDAVRIGLVGSVNLFYDGTIYTGSFDSLSITHAEDKPWTLSYQLQFTVRYMQQFRDTAPQTRQGE